MVEGIRGIESNAVPEVRLPQATSVRDIFAHCDDAPISDDIDVRVNVDGEEYAVVSIADGTTIPSTVADGKDLPAIPADTPVMIDVLGVGATFPGWWCGCGSSQLAQTTPRVQKLPPTAARRNLILCEVSRR